MEAQREAALQTSQMLSVVARQVVEAGATALVAGSAIYGSDDYRGAIQALRDDASKATR